MGNELTPVESTETPVESTETPVENTETPVENTGFPSVTTESLVPRLGDSLLEAGIITSDQLQLALDYQKNQAAGQGYDSRKANLLGQALSDLGFIDREALDQAIARQLISLHEALQDSNRQLELRVKQRTEELERRIVEIRTAAEITQLAITSTNLDELLNRTVNLIADRFGYNLVTIFLIDPLGQYAVLSEASGATGKALKETGYKLLVGSQSMVGWVAANNQARVSANVGEDPFYLEEKDWLPNTKAEATIPLSVYGLGRGSPVGNPQVLGVMDVQHTAFNTFDQDAIATLQTIANHIAATIHNLRLLENTQSRLKEISSLYQTSHQIAQAVNIADIIDVAVNSLKQAPLFSAVLLPDPKRLNHKDMIVYQISDRDNADDASKASDTLPTGGVGEADQEVQLHSTELMNHFIANEFKLVNLEDADDAAQKTSDDHHTSVARLANETHPAETLPHTLLAIPRRSGCKAAAFLPVIADGNLEAIFILGARHMNSLTETSIQPYASLSAQTTTALEKVYALQKVEKRLTALQTLNTISQAVSIETDLQSLYRSVHHEVNQIMGDVNFIVALYDKETELINIPYMYEEHTVKSVDSFPLGEGLTSILIRTRQPLMIVEDTENRTRELGAIVLGTPAKSWMGVPLLIGGEAIGAMIVQDLEMEFRFDEDDLRLMTTLALQVAAGLRNARLLESTYRQAERDRMLHEISRKIRSSTEMQTILKTTAQELGKFTGARRVRIELGGDNI